MIDALEDHIREQVRSSRAGVRVRVHTHVCLCVCVHVAYVFMLLRGLSACVRVRVHNTDVRARV